MLDAGRFLFRFVIPAMLFVHFHYPVAVVEAGDLKPGTEHLLRGRYEEAEEEFASVLKDAEDSAAGAIGLAQSLAAQGKYDDAITRLTETAKASQNADVLAWLAELQLRTGLLKEAAESAAAAIEKETDQPRARLVQAYVYVETGELKEADVAFRWFVRFYNRAQPEDAETLLLVADGAAVYARWHSVSNIFSFVVNTLCPDALASRPMSWRAHYVSGSLLLEKYNRSQAVPDLKKALTVNPRAVEAIVALGNAALQKHDLKAAESYAQQALEAQSNSVGALQLKADVDVKNSKLDAALESLAKAREVNPIDQGTLGRIAACYYLIDSRSDDDQDKRLGKLLESLDKIDEVAFEKPTRLEEVVIEVARRNAKPGRFLTTVGEVLEARRKFTMVESLYKHATRLMPQLSQPKTALGMLYMQTGRTDDAKKILDGAFKADPYHVRVSNMRKVLGVLNEYNTITTDHFVIRVDKEADRILGVYLAEYLEEIYDELVELYDYEPQQRTTFEIYHNAKGLSSHQWFSARMVGLPWIQTIGASTGMMVALASPTAGNQRYNWARVVKHEFVHVITLQQTKFNIPHWFTEALAVTSEEIERPAEWNRLLSERVPRGEISSLDELNHIFIRPESPADWQFAYCQSRLYAQYMIETYGEETIAKMLDAYRRNVSTNDAIPEVFGVSVDEFEKGYHEFLNDIVSEIGGSLSSTRKTLAELEKEHLADPQNTAGMAAYAKALLDARRIQPAEELASKALQLNPKEPLAAYVMAQLKLGGPDRDLDAAVDYLKPALNRIKPNRHVLGLLARVRLIQGRPEEAADLYELGREKLSIGKLYVPGTDEWLKGLAAAYVQLNEADRMREVLRTLARIDSDNVTVRKKLVQLALDRSDMKAAHKWAIEALHIDVTDAEIHTALAKVYEHQEKPMRAKREREFAELLSN